MHYRSGACYALTHVCCRNDATKEVHLHGYFTALLVATSDTASNLESRRLRGIRAVRFSDVLSSEFSAAVIGVSVGAALQGKSARPNACTSGPHSTNFGFGDQLCRTCGTRCQGESGKKTRRSARITGRSSTQDDFRSRFVRRTIDNGCLAKQ